MHSNTAYAVAHVWYGHFFRLDEHLQRYFAGMEKLRMSILYNETQLTALLLKLVGQSGLRNACVEMITTRARQSRVRVTFALVKTSFLLL